MLSTKTPVEPSGSDHSVHSAEPGSAETPVYPGSPARALAYLDGLASLAPDPSFTAVLELHLGISLALAGPNEHTNAAQPALISISLPTNPPDTHRSASTPCLRGGARKPASFLHPRPLKDDERPHRLHWFLAGGTGPRRTGASLRDRRQLWQERGLDGRLWTGAYRDLLPRLPRRKKKAGADATSSEPAGADAYYDDDQPPDYGQGGPPGGGGGGGGGYGQRVYAGGGGGGQRARRQVATQSQAQDRRPGDAAPPPQPVRRARRGAGMHGNVYTLADGGGEGAGGGVGSGDVGGLGRDGGEDAARAAPGMRAPGGAAEGPRGVEAPRR